MGEMMLGQEGILATKGFSGNISFPYMRLRSLSGLIAECRYRIPTKADGPYSLHFNGTMPVRA